MKVIKREIGILGGGLAGLSLAYFLKGRDFAVVEKESEFGGLARSRQKNGVVYDVGPHILFSKNPFVLDLMNQLSNNIRHKRSNKIFHKGKFVTYPFENYLAQMEDKADIEYCLRTFLHNPHETMKADNMLAFFLKTFGEGITNLYLRPYNEKIWKFDPSQMDTQMLERIPKPPKEHIIESARGRYSDGYLHQLFFFYPRSGGIQSLVNGFVESLKGHGAMLCCGQEVTKVAKIRGSWRVKTDLAIFEFQKIVNCLPLHVFLPLVKDVSSPAVNALAEMKFNSICVVLINVLKDSLKDNFAVMVAQKDVIFHRISKLDFMGDEYHLPGSSTLLAEVTFREGDASSRLSDNEMINRCINDLVKIGFIESQSHIQFAECHREKFAYVIYDLNHRKNTDTALGCLRNLGIDCNGRFAEFEYLNMDGVIEHSARLAEKLRTVKC